MVKHKNGFKCKWISWMLAFLIALTREEEIGTRSGRAGPSFSVRPEKEAKGAAATVATVACARHIGSRKR